MKYKRIKIIMIMLLSIAFIGIFTNKVFASGFSDVLSGGDSFLSAGSSDATINETLLQETSSQIYNILLTLGTIVVLVVGIIIGIKLMTSEAENKAEAKKSLVVFVVGSVIVFGAFGIWKTLVNVVNDLDSSVTSTSPSDNSWDIIDGEKDVSSFSDDELKAMYSSNSISSDIYHWTSDPRNPNKVDTVGEAVEQMSEYKQKIYNECKKRGLLKSDGISLKN